MAKNSEKANSVFGSTKKVFVEEREKLRAKKQEKKKIPFGMRVFNFVKTWGLRLFYTVFFCAFSYVFVLLLTALIPSFANIVLQGVGFTYSSFTDVISAGCAALFATVWIFVISFFVERAVFRLYVKGIKNTLSEKVKAKMEENVAKAESLSE